MKITKTCRDAIMASRLIRSDSQRAVVSAALDNPVNAELVKQLNSYLGDEGKQLLKQAKEDIEEKVEQKKAAEEQEMSDDVPETGIGDRGGMSPRPSGGSFSGGTPRNPMLETGEDIPDLPGEIGAEEPEETPDVESSTIISGKAITASQSVRLSKLIDLTQGLKGFLNAKNTTSGVSRVSVKEDETWIYFDDSINLNSVMGDVIDGLANPYPWLAFNRLARSENAMVFVIDFINQYNTQLSEEDEK